jgi:hypothetical protein
MNGVPNIIYTYWDEPKLPKLIDICINSWRIHNPSFKIIVINKSNLSQYVKRKFPKGFMNLSVQTQSDWIRLCLVSQTGGVWADASILMTQSLDKCFDMKNYEFIGVENGIRIENWFFAATKETKIINLWLIEFEKALSEGAANYIKRVGQINNWITGDLGLYLYHQLCLLNVIRKSDFIYNIKLYKTEVALPIANNGESMIDSFMNSSLDLGKLNSLYWKTGVPPMYKITGISRDQAILAINGNIEYNSPLHRAGMLSSFLFIIRNIVIMYLVIFLSYCCIRKFVKNI